MQHRTTGKIFCLYSIRDEYKTLIKIQYCSPENINRVLRFYKSKYPAYTITPIIKNYCLSQNRDINDVLKTIDNKLRPAPIYNHNYTPRANTKRLQKYQNEDEYLTLGLISKILTDIFYEYNELDIYNDITRKAI